MERDTQRCEIGKVAGREREIVCKAGGGDQGVHRTEAAAFLLRPRQKAAAGVGNFRVYRQDAW